MGPLVFKQAFWSRRNRARGVSRGTGPAWPLMVLWNKCDGQIRLTPATSGAQRSTSQCLEGGKGLFVPQQEVRRGCHLRCPRDPRLDDSDSASVPFRVGLSAAVPRAWAQLTLGSQLCGVLLPR